MALLIEYYHLVTDTVLISGFGWAFFLAILIYMLWWLKRDGNRIKVTNAVKWIFLEVKVDELNEKSPLAMEQIFAAMHAIHQNFTWGEGLAGRTVLWMSCEMVSIGGKVSFIFKMPERYRTLFESAVFAQYPKAEVRETEDYLKNLPLFYNPKTADFDFWGTQMNKKKNNAYPIRLYTSSESYEQPNQETTVDSVSNIIEVLSNLGPHELMAYQLVIRPVNDDWKEHVRHMVDKLKGVPLKHGNGIFEKILFFIPDVLADILVTGFLGAPKGEEKSRSKPDEPPSQMLHKTDVEKKIISSIEMGLGKIGYEIRLRLLYLAPKGKLNKALRIPEIIGAFRNFDDVNLNGLKPDLKHTWTDKAYKLSERLEKPYLEMNILTRKRHLLFNFMTRSIWKGSGKVILNTEELATIFHFPQAPNVRISQLQRVQNVKAAPPMDLPIGEL